MISPHSLALSSALLSVDDVSTVIVPGSSLLSSSDRTWRDVQVVQRRHPSADLAAGLSKLLQRTTRRTASNPAG